jgi:hypothetical protein
MRSHRPGCGGTSSILEMEVSCALHGKTAEWKSWSLRTYQRRTKQAERDHHRAPSYKPEIRHPNASSLTSLKEKLIKIGAKESAMAATSPSSHSIYSLTSCDQLRNCNCHLLRHRREAFNCRPFQYLGRGAS